MDVNVLLLENIVRNAQALGAAAHHGQRRLYGLLHDIAQLAGALHLALARHGGHFNSQQFPPDLSPRESGNLANLILFLGYAIGVTAYSKKLVEIFGRYGYLATTGLRNQRLYHLATNLGNFTLKTAHPCFTGVIANDVADCTFRDGHFFFF